MIVMIDLPNWMMKVSWYTIECICLLFVLHLFLTLMNKLENKYGNNGK